jgi:hypothetical protein
VAAGTHHTQLTEQVGPAIREPAGGDILGASAAVRVKNAWKRPDPNTPLPAVARTAHFRQNVAVDFR